MKKKIALVCAAAAVVAVFPGAASPALAACNDGTSQARDFTGSPNPEDPNYNPNYGQLTHEDDVFFVEQTGTLVYGSDGDGDLDPGYLGVTGSRGWIEVSGNNDSDPNIQVDGQTAGGEVDGRVGVSGSGGPDLCINGTEPV